MVEEEERMLWKGRFEFLFTTFGYLIGLGNVWRFPEKCYRHGGGAFLFPYLLTVVFCTIPMMFMEMCLGQFSSEGPIRVWKISPAFVGVGWAIMFVTFVTTIYYITPIMFALYYMLVSFVNIGGTLPWQHCRPYDEWSTKECIAGNTSAEEEYWNRFVLGEHESEGVHDLGGVVLRNACLLLVMWIIVYYCCLRGIRSIAKVIYVTATFPFGIIIILLVRGLTLKGHSDGIAYYLKPDWSKLSDMNIWSSAANQAIYSLGIAYGSHNALASHNQFRNNIFRDAIIIGVTNTLTSFLLGLVVFSFLGHGSHELNIPVEDMIDHGPGVLFISYIQGITQLPGSPIWAVLFFLMVFTLGLDSQFVMVWTMVSCLQDSFPKIAKKYRRLVLAGICLLMFILGIPLATKGGIHMIVLMDRYVADIGLATLMLCEAVSVCWIYGLTNFIRDVEMMIGHKSRHFWWFWKLTWMITVPLFGVFIFIASCVGYKPSSYRGKEIGAGGEAIGWLIILTPLVIVGACAVIQIRRYHGVRAALFNSDKWRPRRAVDRIDRYANSFQLDMPALKLANDNKIENDAGFQNEEHVYNISGEVPTHELGCGASENRFADASFAKISLEQHGTESASPVQERKRVSDTRIFDSYEGWESDETVGPPTPHSPVQCADKGDGQSSSDGNDVFLTNNSLPGHGYITAISKRPAPSIPQPSRCDSNNLNEDERENLDV